MKKTPKYTPKTSSSKLAEKALFLINDDYNTFDHVIDCLVAICDHDPIQAVVMFPLKLSNPPM